MTATLPLPARGPLQPSPLTPPKASQPLAPWASQDSSTELPTSALMKLLARDIEAAGAVAVRSTPVPWGSSTERSVAAVPVGSALEFHTAASDVKSLLPLEPLGAVASAVGQDS